MKITMKMLAAALLLVPLAAISQAADHLDAPGVMTRADLDINDLYVFQSAPGRSAMILTVNPIAGADSAFASDGDYQFQIDNDGDALFDVTYSARFGAVAGGAQTYTLSRNGTQIAMGSTVTGTPGVQAAASVGNGIVQAGQFDDPFFFDLNGFNDGFNFTGDDFFAGLNVNAIVFEVDSSDFTGADSNVALQGTTLLDLDGQFDRIGRPAINTALIASGRKDDFNEGFAVNDLNDFGGEVNGAIAGLSNQGNADALTPILLPDLLTFDVSDPSGFLNGRQLADDVIDVELGLLTAGGLTTDGVDANDRAFPVDGQGRGIFPFLASANVAVPEPASGTILVLAAVGAMVRRRRR